MSFSLISDSHGPLLWESVYPKGYQGPRLAGCIPYYCSGDFGSAFMQEVVHERYTIRYFIFNFLQKMVVRWQEDNRLRAQFVLNHSFSYVREKEAIWVKPHHFNLVWAPGQSGRATFQRGKEYRLLCILFNPPLVQQLHPSFPSEGTPSEKSIQPTEPHLNELMLDVLTNPHSDHEGFFYFENKIREMLFSLYVKYFRAGNRMYSDEEIAKVHQVDSLILEDLKNHYSIRALAKKVRMREARLKQAFAEIIGMGTYERLKEARLQKARELLLTTDIQVKNLYPIVGYESITGFIDAFRDRFLFSPNKYRKKFGPNDEHFWPE